MWKGGGAEQRNCRRPVPEVFPGSDGNRKIPPYVFCKMEVLPNVGLNITKNC